MAGLIGSGTAVQSGVDSVPQKLPLDSPNKMVKSEVAGWFVSLKFDYRYLMYPAIFIMLSS